MSVLHGLQSSRPAVRCQEIATGHSAAAVSIHAARLPHTALRTQHLSCSLTPQLQLHSQHQHQHQQQQQHSVVWRLPAAAAAEERTVSYEWSWQQKGRSHLPEADSQFDQQHPLPFQPTLQDCIALLTTAAAACEAQAAAADAAVSAVEANSSSSAEQAQQLPAAPPTTLPSQAWLDQLLAAVQPLLQQAAPSSMCEVLQLLSRVDFTPDSSWMQAVLTSACSRLSELSTQQLATLVWSLSDLRYTPTPPHWQAVLRSAQSRLEDFYGPDLALLVCGAGSILSSTVSSFDPEGGVRLQQAADAAAAAGDGAQATPAAADTAGEVSAPAPSSTSGSDQLPLPAGFADAVLAEVQYQVTEFPADLGAFDLARMASGLADLGISPSTALQDRLMKAVYMRTRTIEEKGAVDFALAKLDAKGKKSMHYDPRWTHEELKWLPRRERDKRRLIKEGWYRTQWTGWRA